MPTVPSLKWLVRTVPTCLGPPPSQRREVADHLPHVADGSVQDPAVVNVNHHYLLS
jgi:hypothetical protein